MTDTIYLLGWSSELVYGALIVLSVLCIFMLLLLMAGMRKQQQRDREAMQKLEEKNREIVALKDSFIANMTHEIRTPLNAIVGFATMIIDIDDLDPESKAMCRKEINDNKEHLLQLVSDLFDYSCIESNTLEYVDEDTDIMALIDETCMRENGLNHAEGVEARVVERIQGCRLRIDKKRFTQVMANLVHNALKFTQQGSVSVGARRLDNGSFYFYVADTGCGMDEEGRRAIFDRFVKMNKNIKGTGLGLSISKAIVEHYGGGIGVESKKGEGSTFYFTLPATLLFKEYGKF